MLDMLSMFGFEALWSPYFLMLMIFVLIAYYLVITLFRENFKNSSKVSIKQQLLFVSGIVLLYVIKGGPVDLLGHLLFSAHMTQMALLFLAVPPLLMLGLPEWFLRWLVSFKTVHYTLVFFGKPLIALFVFNGLFSFYHLPLIFDTVKTDALYHGIAMGILFFTSIMMWWPIVSPFEDKYKISPVKKIGYIFANGVLITPACALIIFASAPLYATFTDSKAWADALQLCVPLDVLQTLDLAGPYFFDWMPPLEDQQLGGVVMKIIQEIVYGTTIGYVFFGWVRREKVREKEQVLPPYVAQNESI
ncbi:cytochrome c oxidase assembly factor CtaG [Priestia taiwanensis]|uniref:Cytochrome c oxidase assembly factor CtaG n=1 Tax=Priestia taiwanensis TaxID=1347902 RepID=A0A917AQI8_9BACI|nr:cytochrome c oxidase assembly factor CtaG [Priestia taiwanensis]MBM7362968.1 putative membrane protein [Priestia taiwanensis]GGE66564.1 cytochrome c oxidase assembly factor CtaG [Priestia taiwanensis]